MSRDFTTGKDPLVNARICNYCPNFILIFYINFKNFRRSSSRCDIFRACLVKPCFSLIKNVYDIFFNGTFKNTDVHLKFCDNEKITALALNPFDIFQFISRH